MVTPSITKVGKSQRQDAQGGAIALCGNHGADVRHKSMAVYRFISIISHGITPVALAATLLLIVGCTGGQLKQARDAFFIDGDPDTAVQMLESDNGSGLSGLLFDMEKGLLLHYGGRFEESIAQLRQASALMERQDYLSISQQATSMVANDWMTQYKGEYCERLWVHTYLIINYLMVRQYEDALVEAKQALKVFDTYPEALSDAYFSMALIGLCYEMLGEFNDAYIVYKRLVDMMPDPAPIRELVLRMGSLSGIEPESDSAMPDSYAVAGQRDDISGQGELIVFAGMGNGPVKEAGNIVLPPGVRISFPRYANRSEAAGHFQLNTGNQPLPGNAVSTDLNRVARISLGRRAAQVALKQTARVIAKEAIARKIGRKNDEIVGLMARMVLMALEEADTRSWQTLPATNTLLRLSLDPGRHQLTLSVGSRTIDLPPFTLEKGQRIFYMVRSTGRFTAVYGR
ncbi:MAG: hypothetical protein CSA23_06545 [Deltaproteobacteria bacterium]|nr:MAG: hypothetical protein CSA23_06545 [Deltaproteobacteria bacterium]